ncbi:MAG TPA: M20 family metallopeptidase [Planctomycetaceae bacterium]|nr:M20 family metallopeptidase [Planctomycetaceae bacterium]
MNAVEYLKQLIPFPSVSNTSNAAISNRVAEMLTELQFEVERLEYDDPNGVRKVSLVAKRGSGTGGFAYFAHTDVVPAVDWKGPQKSPFEPFVQNNRLYGRGSCDMKGSLACILAAASGLGNQRLSAPLYVTCTADEEIGFGGAADVARRSKFYREMVEHDVRCVIGEPTELSVVYAHKGVVGFHVTARGRAAHSSTRAGINANLAMIPFLQVMKEIHDETETEIAWRNDEFDPPTVSWNIGINDHTHAYNITPPQSICTVYFRPMPGTDVDSLLDRVKTAADSNGLEYSEPIRGNPLYTPPDSEFVREMLALSGNDSAKTVAYGTDGSMFSELNRIVVFGPGGIAQAHTHDEFIELDQLERGTQSYSRLIEEFCLK